MRSTSVFLSVHLLLLVSAPLAAQPQVEHFTVPWSRPGSPGVLEIDLVSGSITVEAHDLPEAHFEISALVEKREPKVQGGLREIPNTSFGFSVEEEDNVMTVEAESWKRTINVKVKVPSRTSLRLETVNNGNIRVQGVQGDHELSNTNGGIEATAVSGSVVAETVNGPLTVSLRRVTPDRPMSFVNLNGDVDVTLPAGLRANVRMHAENGSMFSDFDIALDSSPPRVSKERSGGRYRLEVAPEMRGSIGGGGPEMHFETFNGDIYIRRAR